MHINISDSKFHVVLLEIMSRLNYKKDIFPLDVCIISYISYTKYSTYYNNNFYYKIYNNYYLRIIIFAIKITIIYKIIQFML